ncbi:hypothetical protein [Paenibacillus zanthoxyli]|uniref:hypothetical protein n=1 Tax=Paenibacillus zanthoxyli TaxID=369399 RepID=UPI00046F1EC3|nr:hypothetical protein [Paenibacillus zanthoxyli]
MKINKVLLGFALGVAAFSLTGVASAASIVNEGSADEVVTVDFDSGSGVPVQNIDKTSETLSFAATASEDLHYYWKLNAYDPVLGDPYVVSQSTANAPIDYISAKARVFDDDETLLDTKLDEQKGSSIASAKAEPTDFYYGDDYAIGNHTFKQAGYSDMVKETRVEW